MEVYSSEKKSRKWLWISLISVALIMIIGGFFLWKTGTLVNKISTKGGFLKSVMQSLPGVEKVLQGEKEGRINIVLLGMRGENVPGGGLLADTIMILSIKPAEKKASLVSIPRDFYVTVPGTSSRQKINAVHYYGEEKGKGQGLEYMKQVLTEITGQPMHYAVSINFSGFKDVVNALGGVTIHLDQPFTELLQFRGLEARCDGNVFTVSSGNIEKKKITRKNGTYYFKEYPMCFPETPAECGGKFQLPAGDNNLNGDQALCYARARVNSNDFQRARRQQEVLKQIKSKALSLGTLSDFGKINGLFDSLGENARTDMEAWEMKRFFDIYQQVGDVELKQKVLENSEEGLLYAPESTPEHGYILLPRGENYDRIRELFLNVLN